MADQVTNVEIEDVLSSIRKLVVNSDQAKDYPSGEDADPKPTLEPIINDEGQAPAAETAEPLILTSALRIEDPQYTGDSEADLAEPVMDDQSADLSAEAYVEAEKRPSAAPEADAETPFILTPESSKTSEQTGATDKDELSFEPVLDTAHSIDAEPTFTSQETEEPATLTTDAPVNDENTLEDQIESAARFEKIIAARDLDWSADGAPGTENAAVPDKPLAWTEIDNAETINHDDIEPVPVQDDVITDDEIGKVFSTQEPVQEETFDTEQIAQAVQEADDDLQLEHPIDEDELRQMIVQIMQEQLQGAFGERITSNVRKLVRSEIHRALATRELE